MQEFNGNRTAGRDAGVVAVACIYSEMQRCYSVWLGLWGNEKATE